MNEANARKLLSSLKRIAAEANRAVEMIAANIPPNADDVDPATSNNRNTQIAAALAASLPLSRDDVMKLADTNKWPHAAMYRAAATLGIKPRRGHMWQPPIAQIDIGQINDDALGDNGASDKEFGFSRHTTHVDLHADNALAFSIRNYIASHKAATIRLQQNSNAVERPTFEKLVKHVRADFNKHELSMPSRDDIEHELCDEFGIGEHNDFDFAAMPLDASYVHWILKDVRLYDDMRQYYFKQSDFERAAATLGYKFADKDGRLTRPKFTT